MRADHTAMTGIAAFKIVSASLCTAITGIIVIHILLLSERLAINCYSVTGLQLLSASEHTAVTGITGNRSHCGTRA